MHFERARGLGDLKRGIRGRPSCLPRSCELAKQNSSPLVSPFWIKEFLNLKSVFLKEKFAILQIYKFLKLYSLALAAY